MLVGEKCGMSSYRVNGNMFCIVDELVFTVSEELEFHAEQEKSRHFTFLLLHMRSFFLILHPLN